MRGITSRIKRRATKEKQSKLNPETQNMKTNRHYTSRVNTLTYTQYIALPILINHKHGPTVKLPLPNDTQVTTEH